MRECGLAAVEPENHQAAELGPMLFAADDELHEQAQVRGSDLGSDLDQPDAAGLPVELMGSEMDVGGEQRAMCMP
jgi:hypothetical protein